MKPFEFNLQTVLDVRRIREDRLRNELAILNLQEEQHARQVRELHEQYVTLHERVIGPGAPVSGADILATADSGAWLVLAAKDAEDRRSRIARSRQDKAEETHAATRQRKMLESLREKAQMRYAAGVSAAVERQTDDLCARGHSRARSSGASTG